MLSVFIRPLHLLGPRDVQELVRDQYRESDTLELKEALSSREGMDPWVQGETSISDRARNAILSEVVAFANAHGGHVLLGIEESDDHPKRAKRIRPIPRCSELADRLRLQARDSIEPQLPSLEVVGVPTEADGGGVVIIRVSQSRLAPHRLQQTRECYIRRADRTEKMTMREIQDLTLQRERGIAALDARFLARRDRWVQSLQAWSEANSPCFGVRLTMLPTVANLWIDPVYRNPAVTPVRKQYVVRVDTTAIEVVAPGLGWSDRPILRGARHWSENDRHFLLSWEVGADGLLEESLFYHHPSSRPGEEGKVFREWLLGMLLDALTNITRVRETAGFPGAEYALELELHGVGTEPSLATWSAGAFPTAASRIEPQPLLLPRIVITDLDDFALIIRLIFRDILNAAGQDLGHTQITVDPSAFVT
jgi:hypothetical protein